MDQHQELCGRYLVSLLATVLGRKQPGEKPEQVSFEEVFRMAEAHQVSVMALAAAEQLEVKPEPDLLARWRDVRRSCSEINIAQILEMSRLLKSFAAEGIRAVPLKGGLLKFLYPRTEYRQMGDMDILIEGKDAEKARVLMEALGYQMTQFDVNHHDRYCRGAYLVVELHRTLFDAGSDSYLYFKDIWARVRPDEKSAGTYRLSPEDFYLFMTAHFEKHYHGSGSGLRPIMDAEVFLDAYGDSMDWAYIDREFTKLGLCVFHETARQLAMAWFHDGSLSDAARQMERDLLGSGGIYGSRQKYLENIAYRAQKTTSTDYIWRRLFLPLNKLQTLYPVLGTWPVLYPFFSLHRLIKKRKLAIEELRYLK